MYLKELLKEVNINIDRRDYFTTWLKKISFIFKAVLLMENIPVVSTFKQFFTCKNHYKKNFSYSSTVDFLQTTLQNIWYDQWLNTIYEWFFYWHNFYPSHVQSKKTQESIISTFNDWQ